MSRLSNRDLDVLLCRPCKTMERIITSDEFNRFYASHAPCRQRALMKVRNRKEVKYSPERSKGYAK